MELSLPVVWSDRCLLHEPRERSRPQILTGEAPDAVRIPVGCRFHPRCPAAIAECRAIDPELEPHGEGAGHRAACILAG